MQVTVVLPFALQHKRKRWRLLEPLQSISTPNGLHTEQMGAYALRNPTETIHIRRRGDARANSIPVLGTEPASENWFRSCCCSTPGIRFYCKPVTLVRCREIRGENRFSGRVCGKWLCEMTSAFIIKELRGARALRLFCGRSSFPPILPV